MKNIKNKETLFHGTSKPLSKNPREFIFRVSGKEHWLGEGMYFYKHYKQAFKWAYCHKSSVFIYQVEVESNSDKILDFQTDNGKNYLIRIAEAFGLPNPSSPQSMRQALGIFSTQLLDDRNQYDYIICEYARDEIYTKPMFSLGTEVHYVVVNPACIKKGSEIHNER